MSLLYTNPILEDSNETKGTGWLQSMPDLRDYTHESPKVAAMAKLLKIGSSAASLKAVPASVDLRAWCSPIEDQQTIGSCTAHAAVGIVEYFQKRAFGVYLDGSRLFVHKMTRNLMGVTGDTGAWLRNTMGALALGGVPPEKYWPYVVADFDKEPPAFTYAVGNNFQALTYFCHDPASANLSGDAVLLSVKAYLAAGVPSMFGFFGFPSFEKSDVKGGIPYPAPGEKAQWGHAIMAVGYDDAKKIKNTVSNKATTGALLIRNSWGKTWGDKGYGWLPYEYVKNKLADDFWSMNSMDWVNSKQFGL